MCIALLPAGLGLGVALVDVAGKNAGHTGLVRLSEHPSPLTMSLKQNQLFRADVGAGSCASQGLLLWRLLSISSERDCGSSCGPSGWASCLAVFLSYGWDSSCQTVNISGCGLWVQFPLGEEGPVGNGDLQTLHLVCITFRLLNQTGPHQARPCFEVGSWKSCVVGELCKQRG